MLIENCTIDDFNQITRDIIDFWGSDRTLSMHHPYLVHEFGNTAFVIRNNGVVIAYLFGFFSQTESVGYVHLIGVREQYQKQGLGELLYANFIQLSKSKGIQKLKAVTTPTNTKSINFHQKKIGMTLLGLPNSEGINVIRGYSGPDKETVVFEKIL
ncbi:GNAT family N-acetyltransferase [Xanthocytophaga flava]|uniref:GNAT family N-acetyltransferase n=1 Tax=Xanthocytophaga flava TaxID=3048013 RepID=UPI0028D786D2|nr:GNAT family N-acetyltransferase [Xanthocytophaga flavus]MDJ1469177.1 GNAT family N-acetyltransferase [Xanthocytophaga flavus]